MDINKVEDLYISRYKALIEQALNIGSFLRQGEFKFLDSEDEKLQMLSEIEFFRQKGILKNER